MRKPSVDHNVWRAHKGFHRSELANPNMIEWIQAKRLRALFRAVEPSLQVIRDPEKVIVNRDADITYNPIPWFYNVLSHGIDPMRDGEQGRPSATTKERNKKYHPTMRKVLGKDLAQLVEARQM